MRIPWVKRMSVIVVPEGGATTYSFQLRTILVLIALSVAVVLFFMSIASMFSFGKLVTTSAEKARLQRRIRLLEVELEKVRVLESHLVEAERTRTQLLTILGAVQGTADSVDEDLDVLAVAALGTDELRLRQEDFLRSVPTTWPARGPMTRGFSNPESGKKGYHPGIDIAAATGTPVRAAAAGTVLFAGSDPEYGNVVIIDHGLGLETRYAHNHRLGVRTGDRVNRGQLIAAVGNTGNSTAPHLHFEIRKEGVPIDPRTYLD